METIFLKLETQYVETEIHKTEFRWTTEFDPVMYCSYDVYLRQIRAYKVNRMIRRLKSFYKN